MKLYTINTGYFKLDGGAMFGVVPKNSPLNPPKGDLISFLNFFTTEFCV